MEVERPQLYFFLLPFTIISMLLYVQILIEIYCKKGILIYDSQSLYDISYVIMNFIMEIPQKIYDWPSMYPFLLVMNGTILPQLIYAHIFMCLIAQIIGVTVMTISRVLLICYPTQWITKVMKNRAVKRVIAFHSIVPAIYAVLSSHPALQLFQINSRVLCIFSSLGSLVSALSYIRILMTLRKRPLRTWRSEISILATSFVLFGAVCMITAYFMCNLFIITNKELYFNLHKHFYAFTFFLSLANP
ncbi:hypothetical protein PRIPAC_80336 [Pristionchus pacificus]|uniref:G protein-coupled receptor n=1 Tax=Pristionchus pacificus TaxID=54126 RepID=A0A2A6C3Q1_PRIPA|nr:hypothetical protein PRIPAC_80336 [Pristionchus pacificus]|eukprot:PDM72805.1 G protein-coupled receptor [Pristionchus pacificus]